ncbi:MAG TPA: type II secretion system F family protein [bacterium]|jgi:type IV pilus assembly protein PilC|nr:type II secretion system F family protein [bacterium]HOG38430.1 type II secretion system F family protein [bacterium]HQI03308.1 type II secretion system F family protein [bacterium]
METKTKTTKNQSKITKNQSNKIFDYSKKEEESSSVSKSISKSINLENINQFFNKITGVPLKEKLFFVQHLAVMLRVGISLSKALFTLSLQTTNKYFQEILVAISERVDGGESFAECLKSYPKVFNELFVNMIKAGESSGQLEDVLKQLYIQMKKEHGLLSKVKGALTYPAAILLAMVGIGIFMMIVVVPQMMANFQEMDAELPLPTKILIAISDILAKKGILVAIILIILIFVLIRIIRTKKGKRIFDGILLRFPVFGSIIKKINLARFSRNISSLLKTEIMIVNSFEIVASILGNSHYKEAMSNVGHDIKKGVTVSESVKKYPKLFPPMVVQMIAIGEETGDLDNILAELADFYETEIDQIMTDLPSIIEPMLILFLGVGVAFMAVSILLPMYSLSSAI